MNTSPIPAVVRINLEQIRPALDRHRLILTANSRTRDAILLTHAGETTAGSWRRPRVEAIDLWLQQLWDEQAATGCAPYCEYRILGPVQELLLWIDIIESDRDRPALINTQATARLASQAYKLLLQWQIDDDNRLREFDGLPDIAGFLGWKRRFSERCTELGVVSLAAMTNRLQRAIGSGEIRPEANALLVNFEQPPPLYRNLLQSLVKNYGAGMIHCNGEGGEPDNIPDCKLLAAGDRSEEVETCVAWVLEQQRLDPEAHIAIVSMRHLELAGELEKVFQVRSGATGLECLLTPEAHFNSFQPRFDINRSEPLRAALTLLDCNNPLISASDVCRVLRSPNILNGDEMDRRAMLELHLRRHLENTIRVNDLRHRMSLESEAHFCPAMAKLLRQFDHGRRQQGRRAASDWADLFESQLHAAAWPGSARGRARQQAMHVWQSALEQFRELHSQRRQMRLEQALATIRMLCGLVSAPETFDASCRITLASPDECTGLRFDKMWVLGMDDRRWPEAARPNPLLPYSLQRELDMPRNAADWQQREAAARFLALQKATGIQLVGSYSAADDESELRPSPLVQNLVRLHLDAGRPSGQEIPTTTLIDCRDLPLAGQETPKGGARLLTDQSLCPFRGFAHHRLLAETLPEFSSGPDYLARGILLHTALRILWDRVQDSERLQSLGEDELQALTADACASATAELRKDYPRTVTPVYQELEQTRLRQLLLAQLQLDGSRPAFTVAYREHGLNWEGPGFNLNLQADRIDRLEDGSYFLIDYKSGRGRIDTRKWQGERPQDMQLALYYTCLDASDITPVSGAAMLQLHAEQQQYYGASTNEEDKSWLKSSRDGGDWPALSAAWPQAVARLGREFSDGVNRIDPIDTRHTCEYCDLHSLCRIREGLGYAADPESAEGGGFSD